MKAFQYIDARSVGDVAHALGGDRSKAQVLAGGSDLIQSMKDHIIEPERVINLKNIPSLRAINKKSNGHRFGAAVTLRDLAHNPKISAAYTALAQAAASVGTPQIRNVATLGGNLCQRPRCFYYRDSYAHCTKKGGSRCFVAEKDGNSKYNSIFGDGPCYIVHPSDLATALVALNATIHYSDGHQDEDVAAEDFFTLPKADVTVENILRPNQIVTGVTVPNTGARSVFLKFKEKETADFASAAVAISADIRGGVVYDARVVLGGVAPIPWRVPAAERLLEGKRYSDRLANQVAEAALQGAKPLPQSGYKVPLTKVIIRRALAELLSA